MGAWGPGLYEEDRAADLKSAVALVAKVPGTGERLLDLLRELDAPEPDDTVFWLVVADRFERAGIRCDEVAGRALAIIQGGEDLRRLEALGMDARLLRKRQNVLAELAGRLREPRPHREARRAARPPALVVAPGEVYAYPAMGGTSANAWFPDWERQKFVPDGWGALIVLETGRAFDWLPWCAVSAVSVDRTRRPELGDVRAGRLMPHPQTSGAAKCVPNAGHLKRMAAERLGQLELDPSRASAVCSTWPLTRVIEFGWSISSAAFSEVGHIGHGASVATLLR